MSSQIDIAIIGAGISGVYSAWKLKQKYPSKKIVVFEASKRVGGRLLLAAAGIAGTLALRAGK
jgi:cation diffusion facilitator CzcD-associated flavoprotein CzcO